MLYPQHESETQEKDLSSELQGLPPVSSTDIQIVEPNQNSDHALTKDVNALNGEQQVHNQVSDYWHGETGAHRHWHVYLGDAKTVLSRLPDNHFHCVITSPP